MQRSASLPPLHSAIDSDGDPSHGASAGTPFLLADIGATHARFAVETAPGQIAAFQVYRGDDFAGFQDVAETYLHSLDGPRPRHAAIAIANPIDGDVVRMTNRNWVFSIEATRRALGLDTLLVLNDFTALAMALPQLDDTQRRQIGGGQARAGSVIGLVGPGTGLGVSGLIPAGDTWIALNSEGGHVNFAPADETELLILRHAWQHWPHVSAERLLSGAGLTLIHTALCERDGQRAAAALSPPDIVARGLGDTEPLCREVVLRFCAMLGTVAANLAITLGASGGIYIGGGIVPRFGTLFEHSDFRRRFEHKGRFSGYLQQIPTYLITAPQATMLGASALLMTQLRTAGKHEHH